MIVSALVLALALALAPAQDPGTGTIRGQVRTESTGAPLAAAVVEVTGTEFRRTAATDAAGRFVIHDVPGGRRLLRASHIGHEPLEVEVVVAAGGELHVDFSLRFRPVPLTGVTARTDPHAPGRDTASASLPSLGIAGARLMESAPGIVELGMGGDGRGSPGQAPVDPADVLFVRGVASDLKLVLLDGAPVYSPFHVGGLLDSFDAQLLHNATLYLGGAPARYDGGLSYILDLTTRSGRPDRVHSSGAVDMMSARVTAEGGIGDRFRVLAGGRGVHGYGVEPLLRGAVPYAYAEGLTRVDLGLGSRHSLGLTAFRNREGVSLDSLGNGQEAGWGNTALSLRLRGPLGGADAEFGAAYGAFDASLPTVNDETFPTRGEARRLRFTADLASDAGPLRLRYGASFDQQRLLHQVRSRPIDALSRTWDGAAEGQSAGAYLEGAWQPTRRLKVRAGLRGNHFPEDPGIRVAPRLSATWMLSDRASLTAAGGQYHQYVRTVEAPGVLRARDLPDTLYLPTGLAVDRATHFNLALHQELDDGVRLGVEGFFKNFDGVGLPHSERTQASGVDLWVRRDVGSFRGWLGYSLNWVWSMERTRVTSDEFAGRQLLNAGFLGPLGRWAELEVRFVYGAGLPFSSIPLDLASSPEWTSEPATPPIQLGTTSRHAAETPLAPEYPSDPYLRLDLGLSRAFETRWGDTPLTIAPYVKILNSLDRRDALFYWSDRDSNAAPRAVAALPVLPVVGMSWRF
jgi:hypothetical protein